MKKLIIASLFLTGCWGNSSSDNEAVGQVKKVKNITPIICGDYIDVDISLGVLRNGVGSMSREDVELSLDTSEREKIALLKRAAETGEIVKFTYDIKRWSPCWEDHRLLTIEIEEAPTASAEQADQ